MLVAFIFIYLLRLSECATNLSPEINANFQEEGGVGHAAWTVAGNGSLCNYGAAGERIHWSGKKMKAIGDSRQHIGSATKSMTSTLLAILTCYW